MKTLTLTENQFGILCDLAIEERDALRVTIPEMEGEEHDDAVRTFDELAVMFDLETWEEQDLNEDEDDD